MYNNLNNMPTYVVKSGDSLYMIAKKYNTTVEELMSINHLSNSMIYPNQILFLPNNEVSNDTYLTKNGDTISMILDKFKIDFDTLREYNDIGMLQLMGNQLLKVGPTNNCKSIVINSEKLDDILSKYQTSPYDLLKLNETDWLAQNKRIIVKK